MAPQRLTASDAPDRGARRCPAPGAPVLRDVSHRDPARRGHDAARPERHREVDARAHRRRRRCGPRRATCLLGDQDLTKRRPETIRRAGVAVVPEGRRLLPELSVHDNLRVATYSLSREAAESGIDYALELFPELKRRWDTATRSLSGGEQQMVVLAQALVSRPSVLLVDELSLGLAPVVVKRLVPTLAAVAESGVGVLLIEQFAHVALGLANRAYVLEGGRIRYDGTAKELRDNPDLLHSAYLLRT